MLSPWHCDLDHADGERPEFDDAVACLAEIANQKGGAPHAFGVGCHVLLVDGEPVLPPDEVRSLLEPGTNRFRRSFQQLARQALCGNLRQEEIYAEARAQFRKMQAAGIRISHFDAHKHVHILPSVMEPLLQAAAECEVPALRNPFEPVFSMPIPGLLRLAVRYAEVAALRAFRAKFRTMVGSYGLRATDGSLGLVATGTLNTRSVAGLLERMGDGVWELVCHPGYNDAQLQQAGTRLLASRETEMRALTSEETKRALEDNGIELVSFVEFAATARGAGFASPRADGSSNSVSTLRKGNGGDTTG